MKKPKKQVTKMPCKENTHNSCAGDSGKKTVMPPTYFYVLLLLTIPTYFVLRVIPSPFNFVGLAFVAFGIGMNIWADAKFKEKQTTISPLGTPTALVAEGPFRISRNPMYVGMASILLGAAVGIGSLVAFACPIIFVVAMQTKFLPIEEKNLGAAFSNEYQTYKRKVRQWI
jgi:protein-S-isoprenylcysteine O-methyltransferase Ste14